MLDCEAIRYNEWLIEAKRPPVVSLWIVPSETCDQDYCVPTRTLFVYADPDAINVEQTFRREVVSFWRETAHLSSISAMMGNSHYQNILRIGRPVVPYLLADMQENRRTWFHALAEITKDNPVTVADTGNKDRMIEAWLRWGRGERLIK